MWTCGKGGGVTVSLLNVTVLNLLSIVSALDCREVHIQLAAQVTQLTSEWLITGNITPI